MSDGPKLPKPMSIRSAIEAMKILQPYAKDIKGEADPMMVVGILIEKIQQRAPSDSVRLVSLMYGLTPMEVIDKVRNSEKRGVTFYKVLVEGFMVNPLPDLINAGHMIGLIEEEWTDASRTN